MENKNNNGNDIIAAGADFSNCGVFASWTGKGSTTIPIVSEGLREAGLEDLCPTPRKLVGLAGRICREVAAKYKGDSARAPGLKFGKETKTRAYQARWVISATNLTNVEVGDSVGSAELIVELHDGSEDLVFSGNEEMATLINKRFVEERDLMTSGDVTAWLNNLMSVRYNAARTPWGPHVKKGNRAEVTRLFAVLVEVWPTANVPAPLPAPTCDELLDGFALSFIKEIQAVETSFNKKGKDTESADAARFLRSLKEIEGRAGTYRELCGNMRIVKAQERIETLRTALEPLASTTAQRAALLELDGGPTAEKPVEAREPTMVEKAADKALAARRQEVATVDTETHEVVPFVTPEPSEPFERQLELD